MTSQFTYLSSTAAQLGPIGGPELIVILIVLVLLVGVPIAIVFIVLAIVKSNKKKYAANENTDQNAPPS